MTRRPLSPTAAPPPGPGLRTQRLRILASPLPTLPQCQQQFPGRPGDSSRSQPKETQCCGVPRCLGNGAETVQSWAAPGQGGCHPHPHSYPVPSALSGAFVPAPMASKDPDSDTVSGFLERLGKGTHTWGQRPHGVTVPCWTGTALRPQGCEGPAWRGADGCGSSLPILIKRQHSERRHFFNPPHNSLILFVIFLLILTRGCFSIDF